MQFAPKNTATQRLKIKQNAACLVTLIDRKLQVFKNLQNEPF